MKLTFLLQKTVNKIMTFANYALRDINSNMVRPRIRDGVGDRVAVQSCCLRGGGQLS